MTFIFVGSELAEAWDNINQRELDLKSILGRFSECLRSVSESSLTGEAITPALHNYTIRLNDISSNLKIVVSPESMRECIDYLDKLDETIY